MAEPNQPSDPNPVPPPPPQTGVTANPPPTPAPAPPSTAVAPGAAPPKPPAPANPTSQEPHRRHFLVTGGIATASAFFGSWFAAAWTTFTLSMVGLTLGTVRFMFPNVLSEPPSRIKGGDVSSYEENKVDDALKDVGTWIIRSKDDRGRDIIYALSTT